MNIDAMDWLLFFYATFLFVLTWWQITKEEKESNEFFEQMMTQMGDEDDEWDNHFKVHKELPDPQEAPEQIAITPDGVYSELHTPDGKEFLMVVVPKQKWTEEARKAIDPDFYSEHEEAHDAG